MVICFWLVVPLMYFKNVLYTAYLLVSAYVSFDNTGMPYNMSAVVRDALNTGRHFMISLTRSRNEVVGLQWVRFPALTMLRNVCCSDFLPPYSFT
ncbi:hypothetical protein GGX14DRAFT_677914 [Mycena pura]|uniref:Uncharacterized protein n=1 Tax=Mycena pura TaxID=153505 RepID=A0AAD6Y5B6_9AGAR|nr:hypothetical protein GGX14DRAFT_677914 [Mycena pura]